uniref:CSON004178 protein n=1 Tax=Culicoides sonorensis TaxID=179676 RepID=A0A336M5A6_CULSO
MILSQVFSTLIPRRTISTTVSLSGRIKKWRDKKMWRNPIPNLPNWRKEAGLSQNYTAEGPLTNLPDYTFMDGRPTPLGVRQKNRLLKQREYAERIVQLSAELDFAKDRYQKQINAEVESRQQILKSKLKPKALDYRFFESYRNLVSKMFKSDLQQQFWLTKKIVQRKLGGKEDECIQESDGPLDTKIILFNSISTGCFVLHKVVEQLIDKMDTVSANQNALGKFLNEIVPQTVNKSSSMEKYTGAIGKALSYESQQMNTLRPILARFEHELLIFNNHAVSDASLTVVRMEKERTEYRAALSWMKSVSTNMDPESCKDIQKYRKTQNMVKKSKVKFEREEKVCLQKIDLLSAARCNMLSHVLTPYQQAFLKLTENIAGIYASTLEYLKQCESNKENFLTSLKNENSSDDKNRLLFFENEYKDNGVALQKEETNQETPIEMKVEESNPTEDTEELLLFDLKNEEKPVNWDTHPDLLSLDTLMMSTPLNTSTPSRQDVAKSVKNQSWYNIFAELDPLSNSSNVNLLKNVEIF